jgi:hypothetical protein
MTIGIALAVVLLVHRGQARISAAPPVQSLDFFESKIRPVLVEHCYKCHSGTAKKLKGGLRLDSRTMMLKGGDSGPAIVPGQPEKSRLIDAVSYNNVDLRMPPKGKLPDTVVANLRAWIQAGAPWPEEKTVGTSGNKSAFDLQARKREHWAWQPIHSVPPPHVSNNQWPRDPVDRFILARLEQKHIHPAPPADRRVLLRRVYVDLIGLPPQPSDVEDFVRDSSPNAFEKVVDRLLASPQFGERWARHWLDLVRYAETRGHEFDYQNPNAYLYRDYVIRALNDGVPYDQFVTEHLAGDLLTQPRLHPRQGFNESILGTGFWFLGEQVHSPVDICQDKADRFDNMIDVMSKTFLGLTVACARCHDHKFDAISTRDYYAMFGFLESSGYRLARFDTMEQERALAAELAQLRRQARSFQRALAEAAKPTVDRLASYLAVAHETGLVLADPRRKYLISQEADDPFRDLARARGLNPLLLRRWYDRKAADENDPFFAWDVVRKESSRDAALASLRKKWLARDKAANQALQGAEIIADFGKPRPTDWISDGPVFGERPLRAGEVQQVGDNSMLELCEQPAAFADPAWDRLKVAPGMENEPGALGIATRAGRTLRTPTFEVKNGMVYYLVKGDGLAFVSVDGHVMIAGPLHGKLVMPIKAGAGFHWVEHDIRPYKGRRAHIEFTPADHAADFAVAMVVQADNAPGDLARPNKVLLQLVAEKRPTLKSWARDYQTVWQDILRRMATDRIIDSPDAAATAGLVNWMMRHRDLFVSPSADARLAGILKQWKAAKDRLLSRIKPESRVAMAMIDGSSVDEHVYIRGSYKAPGEVVPRRFLEALAGPAPISAKGSGRLELARQMTDPRLNPFLPRVMVNRLWHHLFGRGVVASVDNFGVLGERPTHPELLDFLADQFIRDGWSIKKMIRRLVLTNAYRMSSQPTDKAREADPENLFLHRMRIRRLEGEAIRDAMLSVSGRLSTQMYGPPIPVHLTEFQEGRGRPASGPLDGMGRRSLYLGVRRNFLSPFLLVFDTPTPFSTVGRRTVSNVPAQSLMLLNAPFVHQQAREWARRELAAGGSPPERITRMYESAFGRPPSMVELTACLDFLRVRSRAPASPDLDRWTSLAHVLFNAKEFIFLE